MQYEYRTITNSSVLILHYWTVRLTDIIFRLQMDFGQNDYSYNLNTCKHFSISKWCKMKKLLNRMLIK